MKKVRSFFRVIRVGLALVFGVIAIVTFGFGGYQWFYAFQFLDSYSIVMHTPIRFSQNIGEDAILYVWFRKEAYENMFFGIVLGQVAYLFWPFKISVKWIFK